MVTLISFEGGIGAGKTSLTNYFSYEFNIGKVLEEYERNPFLREFYEGSNVNLETEISFLLIHYSQLKKAIKDCKDDYVFADFSIEKDLVFALLNLDKEELKIFKTAYEYVIKQVGVPYVVIYVDLSLKLLRRRIFQRGRPFEITKEPNYFKEYDDKVKEYFKTKAQSKVYFFNVDDLEFDSDNKKLVKIKEQILKVMKI